MSVKWFRQINPVEMKFRGKKILNTYLETKYKQIFRNEIKIILMLFLSFLH